MSGKYEPLRVPIGLLHQRAYTHTHRLEAWLGLVDADDKELPVNKVKGRIFGQGLFRPYEGTTFQTTYDQMHTVFDAHSYLRKYWILVDGVSKTMCRGCNLTVDSDMARLNHTNCYRDIHLVLKALVDDNVCVICETQTNRSSVYRDFEGCPVCSEDCLDIWDAMRPHAFELYYAKLQKDGHIK